MKNWCCESCGCPGAARLGAGPPYCAACRAVLAGRVPYYADAETAALWGHVPRCVSCGEPTAARRRDGTPCCPGHLATWPEYMDPARNCFVEQRRAERTSDEWSPVWGGSWYDAMVAKHRGTAYDFDQVFTFVDHRIAWMRCTCDPAANAGYHLGRFA